MLIISSFSFFALVLVEGIAHENDSPHKPPSGKFHPPSSFPESSSSASLFNTPSLFGSPLNFSPQKRIYASSIDEAAEQYFFTHAQSMYSKMEVKEIQNQDKRTNAKHKDAYDRATDAASRSLIVGGVEASSTSFRFITALIYGSSNTYYQFCGGSLISEDTVLTAAHCVDDGQVYFAAIGRYKLTNVTEPGEIIEVSEMIKHPQYNDNSLYGDIAVFKLKAAVTHPHVTKVKLVTDEVHESLSHGSPLTVAGWGLLQEGRRLQNDQNHDETEDDADRRSLQNDDFWYDDWWYYNYNYNDNDVLPGLGDCPFQMQLSWIQDGYCDSNMNIPQCNYDGGDCCEASCDCASVGNCYAVCGSNGWNECVDPNAGGSGIGSGTVDLSGCNVNHLDWIGDGYCDQGVYNTPECNFDGGDCCEESCVDAPIGGHECGYVEYNCIDPEYSSGNGEISFCAPGCAQHQILDSVCHEACNNADCLYDNGSCDMDGAMIEGSGTNTLRKVDVPMVSLNKCKQAYQAVYSDVTGDTVCAGFSSGGFDSCQGDSGGPLLHLYNNEWYQVGVVSWGIGCGRPNLYGVYSSVHYHRSWVEKFIIIYPFDVVNPSTATFDFTFGANIFSDVDAESLESLQLTLNNTRSSEPLLVELGFVHSSAPVDVWSLSTTSCALAFHETCDVQIFFAPTSAGESTVDLVLSTTATVIGSDVDGPEDFQKTYSLVGVGVEKLDFDMETYSGTWTSLGENWNEVDGSTNVYTSGDIDDDEKSCMITHVDVSTSSKILGFDWSVDSEGYYDYLNLYVGEIVADQLTGNIYPVWHHVDHFMLMDPGVTRRVMFCFEKDEGVSSGSDAGFVKNFKIIDGAGAVCEDPDYDVNCNCKGVEAFWGGCVCSVAGWDGNNCRIPTCESECQNGGSCETINNVAQCVCQFGFAGVACEYDNVCSAVTIRVNTKLHASEIFYKIKYLEPDSSWIDAESKPLGSFGSDDSVYEEQFCFEPGTYKFEPNAIGTDGWSGGSYEVLVAGVGTVTTQIVESNLAKEVFQIHASEDPGVPTYSCHNSIQDGPEPDTDCGAGACGTTCRFRKKCFLDEDCHIGKCVRQPNHMKLCSDVGLYVSFPSPNAGSMTAGSQFDITWSVSNDTTVQALSDANFKVDLSLVDEDLNTVFEIANGLEWTSESMLDLETTVWTSNSYIPTGLYRVMAKWADEDSEVEGGVAYATGILFQIFGTSLDVISPARKSRMLAGSHVTTNFVVGGSITFVDVMLHSVNATFNFQPKNLGNFLASASGLSSASVIIPSNVPTGDYFLRIHSSEYGNIVNSDSPEFFVKKKPGVVIVSPTHEQAFVEGEKMKILWKTSGMVVGAATTMTIRLVTECAEAYQIHLLENIFEITSGEYEVELPYIKNPFLTSVEVLIDGEFADVVTIFIRPEASCAPGCLNRFIGDNICQPECFVMACDFDSNDCCTLSQRNQEYHENCVEIEVSTYVEDFGEEMSWELLGSCPSIHVSPHHLKKQGWHNFTSCIDPGRYNMVMRDVWGDGWNGGSVSIKVIPDQNYVLFKGEVEFKEASVENIHVCSASDVTGERDCKLDFLDDCKDGIRLTESGKQCAFPMVKDGIEYRDCIPHDELKGVEQCATEVDPCSCSLDGVSGVVDTGRKGCVEGNGAGDSKWGESVDLICQAEHIFEGGSRHWCYINDPKRCKMQSKEERMFKGLSEVVYYEGVSFVGSGWRYCDARDEDDMNNNYLGDLSICEACGERSQVDDLSPDEAGKRATAIITVSVALLLCVAIGCGSIVHNRHTKLKRVRVQHASEVRRLSLELESVRRTSIQPGQVEQAMNIATVVQSQQPQPLLQATMAVSTVSTAPTAPTATTGDGFSNINYGGTNAYDNISFSNGSNYVVQLPAQVSGGVAGNGNNIYSGTDDPARAKVGDDDAKDVEIKRLRDELAALKVQLARENGSDGGRREGGNLKDDSEEKQDEIAPFIASKEVRL